MGSALLKGWLAHLQDPFISVITPHRASVLSFLGNPRVSWYPSPEILSSLPDVFVFAVKPFLLEAILPLYRDFETLMVSVAAGKPLSFYENLLPDHGWVRAMPNLPVRYGQGVVGLLANDRARSDYPENLTTCFQGLGACYWMKTDEELDKLTAVSGSGPAYVFFLIETLAQAAESLGFDPTLALSLATQTFLGASVCVASSRESPATLLGQVTTPQGTTAAALAILESAQFKESMQGAVQAAFKRAGEMNP